MQDRYAGDIGDYIKLALLRALSPGRKLGVAWYLHPDEDHNADGRHIPYLSDPGRWRPLDPELFDGLSEIVRGERSVRRLTDARVLAATFSATPMRFREAHASRRDALRARWFQGVMGDLEGCDLVFADPDNGLTDDEPLRRRDARFAKSLPLAEALDLARGRVAVLYHHNTRFRGGHDAEVAHWRGQLGSDALAVRANAWSCRTFFVLNPDPTVRARAVAFCDRWAGHRVTLA